MWRLRGTEAYMSQQLLSISISGVVIVPTTAHNRNMSRQSKFDHIRASSAASSRSASPMANSREASAFERFNLQDLAPEILEHIFVYTGISDVSGVAHCAASCRLFRDIIYKVSAATGRMASSRGKEALVYMTSADSSPRRIRTRYCGERYIKVYMMTLGKEHTCYRDRSRQWIGKHK